MATEQVLPFSVGSLVEDVLQQHGSRLNEIDVSSRKIDEASIRRYEAAIWLRKMIGVGCGTDLPAEPSDEEFRLGLRSGIILCSVLNKVQPGAVPKVVEGACDSSIIPDGALSAFQYFENIRNFLVAVEDMGIPAFEASDLREGGKSARVVNCVLALKSYNEWKNNGGIGTWKYTKPSAIGNAKSFVRKTLPEPLVNSFSRTSSTGNMSSSFDQSVCNDFGCETNETGRTRSLHTLVCSLLSNKKQEEIPDIVESMLNKVMEEFERRLVSQSESIKAAPKDMVVCSPDMPLSITPSETKAEEVSPQTKEEECEIEKDYVDEESKEHLLKQKMLVQEQERNVLELKHDLNTTKTGMQVLQLTYKEEFSNLGKYLYGLAHAASGYQKVLEENRKLYNQVQDLKGNIRVYCRVRPFLPGQASRFSIVDNIEGNNIAILTPSKYGKEGKKAFTFNKVFGPVASQEEVFADTQPLIRSVLDGYNVCIFAYGQTGSGKTFTMSGPNDLTEESMGVNYRALNDLFLISDQRKDVICYDISVQMLEIYNEQVRDLLATDGLNKRLEIRNSSQNGINVPDACLVPVSSTSDVINVMNLGQSNRAVCSTAMNDRSSRSHSCLTVHVQGKNLTSGSVLRGSMHLIDLAGSERVDKSEVTGDRLKEAQHINKSLSALGDVIASLSSKHTHVPYRNSKLTQLLQDSLGGQAKTLMFVHISPEPDAVGETISTLKFAERVATIELGAARVNKDNTEVKELKEQIISLKAALGRNAETDSSQHSRSSTPERGRMKPAGTYQNSWHSTGNLSKLQKQLMEDAGNGKVRGNTRSIPRRRSLDLHDLMTNSRPWPPLTSPAKNGKEDDKDSLSGDWVDKVMMNSLDDACRDDTSIASWDADSGLLPDTFYQNHIRDASKIYPEQDCNGKDSLEAGAVPRSRYEMALTDDSDELDAAMSVSSEPDLTWQSNLPRVNSLPTALARPKTKKTTSRLNAAEPRSMIPSFIPSPSSAQKTSNGVSSGAGKTARISRPDGKKRSGRHGK